jgi:SNF2 family DNA or RNA helicase
MDFKVKPFAHQLKAIEASVNHRDYGLLFEPGLGKTCCVINMLRIKYSEQKRVMRTLIVSPLVTLHNWKRELAMHTKIDANKIHIIHGPKKLAMIGEHTIKDNELQECILITNYETLVNDACLNLLYQWCPEIIIADEAHYLKNPSAVRSKNMFRLSDRTAHNYALTGTPILNNEMDIFGIFRFLDRGESFGKNFFVFRNMYFYDENGAWAGKQHHFPKWGVTPMASSAMQKFIFAKCARATAKECLDLPPLVETTRLCELSAEQKRMYESLRKDFIAFVDEKDEDSQAVVAQLAITKAIRLMQIASGFCSTEDGSIVEFKNNPKIDALEELLLQITPENKVIVWASFVQNYRMISKLLDKLGIRYSCITGEQNLTEKQANMDLFNTDPDVKVCLANRKAGGIGINLIAAKYSIVYSRNFSLEEELQSKARNYRAGSEVHDQIIKIDLVTQGTVEEQVVEALKNKKSISDEIIDFIKRPKKEGK